MHHHRHNRTTTAIAPPQSHHHNRTTTITPPQSHHRCQIDLRSYEAFHGWSFVVQLIPAVGVIAFTALGLGPLLRACMILFLQYTEPVILPSAQSQVVKQRLLNFVRSSSTEIDSTSCTFNDAQLNEYWRTSVPSIWAVGEMLLDRMNLIPVVVRVSIRILAVIQGLHSPGLQLSFI
nr:hypothetical protein [Tanacetum cinerariifolium]